MADVMEYKCPACGGAMEFDSSTQKMKCPYCDTEIDVNEFQNTMPGSEMSDSGMTAEWEAASDSQWQESETAGMRVYSCESCGGEIVSDETTGATSCPFCGNRVVMKGQFSGDLRPNLIIPFKLDKKAAKAAYQKHITGKKFLPKVFKDENHIDEIKGVYVPFWLFDADVNANIAYNAERTRTWETGNIEYTEHNQFHIQRCGNLSFQHIPADGSRKMEDTLMESIEPFNMKDAVPFNPAFLAGYVADRYDVTVDECIKRAEERIRESTEDNFRETVQNYTSVNTLASNINILRAQYKYVLYPVWMLNTSWNDKKFTFAMNGQSGKMVGDLPQDKKAMRRSTWLKGLLFGAIIYAVQWILILV